MGWLPARLAVFLVIVSLTACGSGPARQDAVQQDDASGAPAAAEASLPPLPDLQEIAAQLAEGSAADRQSSYVAADLLREGEDFDGSLPSQLVIDDGDGAVFSPDFSSTGAQFSGLSYALYTFTIDEYGGNREFFFNWRDADPSAGSAFLALANWDSQRWRCQQISGDSSGQLPDLTPFFDENRRLVAAVIFTGTSDVELDWLRLGSLPPTVQFSAGTDFGLTPLPVTFTAEGSSDPNGSISEYRWDPEGDGSFQLSSGTQPTLEHVYQSGGLFNAAVRVIDDEGVYGTAELSVDARDEFCFEFGSNGRDVSGAAVLAQPDGTLILVGNTQADIDSDVDGLLARVSIHEEITFSRFWGGEEDDKFLGAVQGLDGNIYVCGSTESFGEGGSDALVQSWSPDGELLWSRSYGLSDGRELLSSIVATDDALYVCGETLFSPTGSFFGLAMRLDLSGGLVWKRSIIAPELCTLGDLVHVPADDLNPARVLAAGRYSAEAGPSDGLLLHMTIGTGAVASARKWSTGISGEFSSISVVAGDPAVYLAGSTGTGKLLFGTANGIVKAFSSEVSTSLAGRDCSGLTLLATASISNFPDPNPTRFPVVFTFNSELSLDSSWRLLAQNVSPSDMGVYDAANSVFCGSSASSFGGSTSFPVDEEVPSAVWSDVTPSVTSPALVNALTDLSTFFLDGRFDAAGTNMFVCVGKLE